MQVGGDHSGGSRVIVRNMSFPAAGRAPRRRKRIECEGRENVARRLRKHL